MSAKRLHLIRPEWPMPKHVHAISTTRVDGFSIGPYKGLNLAQHVNDQPDHFRRNRELLISGAHIPQMPFWLNQVHGINAVCLDCEIGKEAITADASYTSASQKVCTVMTADCLPLLFCDQDGQWVAAVHAGWRGLLAGVIEETVAHYSRAPEQLMVWLGPAIGPNAFEVGNEVRTAFAQKHSGCEQAFRASENEGKYLCDIYSLARFVLRKLSVSKVYGGNYCTYQNAELFYSYRRDGVTGRMASMIWID